ncbi:MAG: DUF882 domain-containing protein [Rhodospirillaceae bacterium]
MGHSADVDQLNRRRFFLTGLATTACLVARPRFALAAPERPRTLAFQNLHTGERVSTDYWADGQYIPGSLEEISKVLRDHRNGAAHAIDPNLLDLLHTVHGKLETSQPFHVISGYRSPESNAKLAAASSGVAKHSMHMDGKAIDIRIPGTDLLNLHKAAKSLKGGGVGYYAASNFVHMDVGRVRYW